MTDFGAVVAELRLFHHNAAADAVEALVAENADLKEDEQEALAERNAALRQRDALQRQLDSDNFESVRDRIAALEAVIERAIEALVVVQTVDGWVDPIDRARAIAKARDTLSLAPSVVLDEMIREAKAEAWDEGFYFAIAGTGDESEPTANPYREVS